MIHMKLYESLYFKYAALMKRRLKCQLHAADLKLTLTSDLPVEQVTQKNK